MVDTTKTGCPHNSILLCPANLKMVNDKVSFTESDIDNGTMYCRVCKEELPIEDRGFYPKKNMFIGVPTDLIDG